MTTDSPGDRPPAAPTPSREPKRPRRGHAALGGRILVAGVGSAATIALTTLVARAELGSEPTPQPVTAAVSPAASTTPAPVAPVVRVVIRRTTNPAPAPAAGGSASAPPRPAPAADTPAPAPPPAPAPAAVPVTRSQTS